jgi:predicted metal-dependent hydrolase
MTDTLHIGTPPVVVRLRRSARARRYSLRISNSDGAVWLTIPNFACAHDAAEFARRQEGWIRKNLAKQPQRQVPAFGNTILFEGNAVRLEPGSGRAVQFYEGVLQVPGRDGDLTAHLRGYFKTLARQRLAEASQRYAGELGRPVGRITLRDTRSRWGSCTSEGNLMYSWRLIMAPCEVLDYVAVHEVCHLVELNHSPAYWALVQRLCPQYRVLRGWLRQNGRLLHQYAL